MASLWSFFGWGGDPGRPDPAARPAPSDETERTLPRAAPPPLGEPPAARAKTDEGPLVPHLDVDALGLPPPLADSLRCAMRQGARALLTDPEEFACTVWLLIDGGMAAAADCSLDDYADAWPGLEALDGKWVTEADVTRRIQLYSAVTDLGRRAVLQLFEPACDGEVAADIRKANVRAINRLRPGTSLTRHNRARLLAALQREGTCASAFLDGLRAEGVSAAEGVGEDGLADLVLTAVLPRKAVAQALGACLGVPFVDVEENLPRAHATLFDCAQILAWEAIPCGDGDAGVEVAMADPTDSAAVAAMEAFLGRPVRVRVAAATDIRVAVDKLFKGREG